MNTLNRNTILAFCLWVPLYAWWGSPLSPLTETLTLVSKYASLRSTLFYAIGYLGIAALASASIFLLAFNRSRKAFAAFIFLALFHCFDLSYSKITGSRFSVSDYIFLVHEIENTLLALDEYKFIILKAILSVSLFIAAVTLLRRRFTLKIPLGIHWLVLLLACAAVVYSLHASDGKRDNYVSAIRLPSIVLYAHLCPTASGLNIPYTARLLGDEAAPVRPPLSRHILFIVDESVTAQYLSINGYPLQTTPYLESISWDYLNLGCVTSTGNLSMSSNYILRNGISTEQLPDYQHRTLNRPSLFNYARKAGMYTALLDAQQQVPALQNYLSNYDLQTLDAYANFPATGPRYDNDFKAIEKIQAIQSQYASSFIMLVKYGAHFPYQDRYPAAHAVFRPDLLSDAGSDDPYAQANGRIKTVNTYLNALRWNVDDFFAALLPALAPDSLVVYTSDHGQSILDENIRANHGISGVPPAAQVSVPLLLFPAADFKPLFNAGALEKTYSQYQIFPSLLSLMGYDHDLVSAYGLPLWAGVMPQKTFSGPLFGKDGLVSDVPAAKAKIALPDGNYAHTLTD